MPAQFRPAYASGLAQFRAAYEAAASGIVIHSGFDRSNFDPDGSVITTDGDGPLIRIKIYPSSTSAGIYLWLTAYGKVSGVLGLRPRFEFFDFSTHALDYRSTTKPQFSADGGQTWQTFAALENYTTAIVFRHDQAFAVDEILIRETWAESVTEMGQKIEALASAHPTKVFPTPSAAAFTPTNTAGWPAASFIAGEDPACTNVFDGRAIPDTPIYGVMIDDQAFGPKPQKWVMTGGVHAGEDAGQLPMRLLMEALLGSSAEAIALRQRYQIIIYPQVNPSGRWSGTHRGTPRGTTDPNRVWDRTTPHAQVPASHVVKQAILADTGGYAEWAFDFHSTTGASTQSRWSVTVSTTDRPDTRVFYDDWNARLAPQSLMMSAYLGLDSEAKASTTGVTIRAFFCRDLGYPRMPSTFEVNQGGPTITEEMFQPFVDTMVPALASLAASYDPEEPSDLAGASLVATTSTGSLSTGIRLAGSAASLTQAAGALTANSGKIIPVLSFPGVVDVTATSARPKVTLEYA